MSNDLASKVMHVGLVPKLIGTGRPGRTVDELVASKVRLHDEQEPHLPVADVYQELCKCKNLKDVANVVRELRAIADEEIG